ncbi:hypothetical protein KC361_g201 [Hortaea werneckii]|nr:hypothetical protein KC361_g201 [Hortaea werneckii]
MIDRLCQLKSDVQTFDGLRIRHGFSGLRQSIAIRSDKEMLLAATILTWGVHSSRYRWSQAGLVLERQFLILRGRHQITLIRMILELIASVESLDPFLVVHSTDTLSLRSAYRNVQLRKEACSSYAIELERREMQTKGV